MRSENENQFLVLQSTEDDATPEFHKKLNFSYTRDFLLSLAELDTCKELPAGFDTSILREFDDQSTSVLPSSHDSVAGRFQIDLSSCPWRNPEQGLLGSVAGRFQSNLSNWAWQNPEQGLLGSGTTSPRFHRGVADTSVPILQSSGFHLLNRSREPYRPPHLCKAKDYAERESKDHCNDETFGYSDNLSPERAEEEKVRRDEFECMRKEQEMAAQEKLICDEHKQELKTDIAIILEDTKDDKEVANMFYLDKSYVSRDGNDQFDESYKVCKNNFESNLHEPISGALVKDSELIALSGTEKDLTSRCKGNEILIAVGHNCSASLTVNESGSIGDVEGIVSSSFPKQSGICESDCNLLVSSIQAKVELDLQIGPEPNHSSASSIDDLDICLPDEDSLITFDDYILSEDSMSAATGETSCASVDTFVRLADGSVAVCDKRSNLANSGSPSSVHGSHDLESLETSFKSLSMQQSHSQLQQSQPKTVKSEMNHFKSQGNQKGSRKKSKDLKTYTYNQQSLQHWPTNVHHPYSQHLQAAATGFGQCVYNQFLQPFPGYFPPPPPPYPFYGQQGVPFPQHTSNGMACYGQDQNAMLYSSPSFQQQRYSF